MHKLARAHKSRSHPTSTPHGNIYAYPTIVYKNTVMCTLRGGKIFLDTHVIILLWNPMEK